MVGIDHRQFVSLRGVDIWDYLGLDPTDRSLTLATAQAAARRVVILLHPDRRNNARLRGEPVPEETRFSSAIANEIAGFLNPSHWRENVSESTIMNFLTAPRVYRGHRSTWNPQQVGRPDASARGTDWNFIMTTTAHQHVFPDTPQQQQQQQPRSRTSRTARSPSVVNISSEDEDDDADEKGREPSPGDDYSNPYWDEPWTPKTGYGQPGTGSGHTTGGPSMHSSSGTREHAARPANFPRGSTPASPTPQSHGRGPQARRQQQAPPPQQQQQQQQQRRRRPQPPQAGSSPTQPLDITDPECIDNLLALAQPGGVVVGLIPRPNDPANASAHHRFWHIVEASLDVQGRMNLRARNFNFVGAATTVGYGRQNSVSFEDVYARGRLLGRFHRHNDRSFIFAFLEAMQAGQTAARPGDRQSEERREANRLRSQDHKRKRSDGSAGSSGRPTNGKKDRSGGRKRRDNDGSAGTFDPYAHV